MHRRMRRCDDEAISHIFSQRGYFAIERLRLCQGLQQLGAGRAGRAQQRVDARQKILRLDAKGGKIGSQPFLAEIPGLVESIEHQNERVNRSRQAAGDKVDLATSGRLVGIVKRETGAPQKSLADALLEQGRVVDNLCFQTLNNGVGIVEGTADGGLGTIHKAVKAIGRLLPVVRAHNTLLALGEGRGDEINVAIEKIDALSLNIKPRAAVDPRSPSSHLSNGKVGRIVNSCGDGTDMGDVQWSLLVIVQPNIYIRVRPLRASCVRSAQNDSAHALDPFQVLNDALE